MLNFQQGDQYLIPFTIKQGRTLITPDNCDDVRIKINEILLSYMDGGVTYNTVSKAWCFQLTEEMSRSMDEETPIQVGIKQGNQIYYSTVQIAEFAESIITEDWYP